jgi:hypothetical protein
LLTFHFVAFCWIFFRADSFDTALEVIHNIGKLQFDWNSWRIVIQGYKNVFLLILIGFVWHFIPKNWMAIPNQMFSVAPMFVKALILGFVFWIVYATAAAGSQPFIYFQF